MSSRHSFDYLVPKKFAFVLLLSEYDKLEESDALSPSSARLLAMECRRLSVSSSSEMYRECRRGSRDCDTVCCLVLLLLLRRGRGGRGSRGLSGLIFILIVYSVLLHHNMNI